MTVRFKYIKKYKDSFRLFENPWSITIDNVAQLVLGFENNLLKEELIDMRKTQNLKKKKNNIFKENAKEKEHYKFWTLTQKDELPKFVIKCSKLILRIFTSTNISVY